MIPPLSTSELTRLLQDHKNFQGVYELHDLDTVQPVLGGSYIVLMLPPDHSCGHYVLVDSTVNCVCYFDPFGVDPPDEVASFMHRFNQPIQVSHAELQNIASSDCGAYCIYVLIHLQHEPLERVLTHFSDNTLRNDVELEQWAKAHLGI